jgi:hypothetical protein
VLFEVRQTESGPRVYWSTLDLIRGHRSGIASVLELDVRNANYIQTHGLKEGENTLDFQIEIPDGVRVRSLEVMPDSGLEWSPVGPGRLALTVTPAKLVARVGDVRRVLFDAKLVSGRPLEYVMVTSGAAHGLATPIGSVSRQAPVVRKRFRGRFAFRMLKVGREEVRLKLVSGTTRRTVVVPVRIRRR